MNKTKNTTPKRAPRKKAVAVVEEAIVEVKQEAVETVGTVTIKRWQAIFAGVVVGLSLIFMITSC